MTARLTVASLSGAMDGALTAVADVADILATAGMLEQSRLIGGVSVLLHQQRLAIDLPLRATGDADFGITPYLLREHSLVEAIEERGYLKIAGNRWERRIDEARTATVDLLIPTYTSRARHTVNVGDVTTTEVPGLADALRRPGHETGIDIVLTDRTARTSTVMIPDTASTLGLKAWARTVRNESRDSQDLWRSLEIALADGVTPRNVRRRPIAPQDHPHPSPRTRRPWPSPHRHHTRTLRRRSSPPPNTNPGTPGQRHRNTE